VLPPLPLSNLHGDGAGELRARVQRWLAKDVDEAQARVTAT
jgi:hypothetical protein